MDSTPALPYERVREALSTVSVLKQDIYKHSYDVFLQFESIAKGLVESLIETKEQRYPSVEIQIESTNRNEFRIQFGGDVLIFSLHTNVFAIDKSHSLHTTNYVLENRNRAYFMMVEVYNFLNDSIKFHRYRDIGEMVARIFINVENHYFIEGVGAIGSLYNDLTTQVFNDDNMRNILESVILSSIQYDLWAPSFQEVRFIPLANILEQNGNSPRTISKRLGYEIKASIDQNVT